MQIDAILNFNLVCCVVGGFVALFGLVSYLLKEGFYVTEPLVSLCAGVFLSPYGVHLIRPHQYAGSPEAIATITLCFTRLVLGIQLVIAGVQLPSKYLKTEWRSLGVLLGPGMLGMWVITSFLAWQLIPGLSLVQGLIIGACVTPTDPVLSNSIVKGTFADKHMSKPLQKIIIAESGANDGLGYLFLFLPLYLVKYAGQDGGTGKAVTSFLGVTCLYTVLLSVLYGAVAGWVAKHALFWAERRRLVDRESFHLFVIALALLIIGTVGLIDADDVLACFIAGNTFTWDDWFRQETKHDSLQPIMDFLLNIAVFMWLGAVCPWEKFFSKEIIPSYRLVLLGVLVLLLRRLPVIIAMRRQIPQIHHFHHALIMGFFGPIGVSAIFYLYVTQDFLHRVQLENSDREDCGALAEVTLIAVWFLVVSSVIVHGLAIPLGNLALLSLRVFSNVKRLGTDKDDSTQQTDRPSADLEHATE
ncbi:Na/H antiporter [Phaeosphaeriaceae sp. PMI808]|nr:Na/H antiporter [Phaeosphaeriaceae sp. PMI808]